MATKDRLDPDALDDQKLTNVAATLVYIMLGRRALELLIRDGRRYLNEAEGG